MSLTTDAIVVGGSVAGLMHALVLKSLGRNVLVIEARPLDDMHAHAAGLSLWPHALKLLKTYATDIDPQEFAFHNRAVQRMTGDGVLLGEIPFTDELWTTSWAVVHKMLWEACEKHDAGDGVVSFAMGKRVCGVREQKDSVMVAYKGHDGTEEEVSASLVFAADGGRSFVRSQVLPDVEPEYAGYLAWRGILLEKDVPQELEGTLDGKLVMLMLSGSYILTYMTPNETGDATPGNRLVEWCWYDTCDASSSDFSDFMTDTNGVRHNHTVTAGLLNPRSWEAQLARRRDVITPLWQRMFAISTAHKLPLLTAIRSFDNTTSSFFDGKLLLAGEAFIQIRPHLGASCSIPGLQALSLVQVLKGEKTRDDADGEVAAYAIKQAIGSKMTGNAGMTG